MNRSDHGCVTFPAQCKAGVPKEHPTAYVKRMYYDSLVFTPEALRHLAAEVGASHIVMGTDYPYPWVDAPVDHVLATPGSERCRPRSHSRAHRDAAPGAPGQIAGLRGVVVNTTVMHRMSSTTRRRGLALDAAFQPRLAAQTTAPAGIELPATVRTTIDKAATEVLESTDL